MHDLGKLTGTIKYYDWGGTLFIPLLVQQADTKGKPFAEYWLGVHPQADCRIIFPDESEVLLRDYILSNPQQYLGEYTCKQFGNMPYLLKALDVNDMLSIQVHPSKAAAERDYEEENKKGVALNAPNRNYRDNNHKPELLVAIGEFWLLHGFRPPEEMKQILRSTIELSFLLPVFEKSGYEGLYKLVMELPQVEANQRLQPLIDRIVPLYERGILDKSSPDYWAAKAHITFSQKGNIDRGIFSVYLFNLVRLNKGEAIFQDAGLPHAYLQGQNIEIMASSDNVLRGGLTTKHIDVPELLKHVNASPTYPDILKGEIRQDEVIYGTKAPDFELRCFPLDEKEEVSFQPATAEILLLSEGEVKLSGKDAEITLKMGQPSAIVFPGGTIGITATKKSLLFRATVPVNK